MQRLMTRTSFQAVAEKYLSGRLVSRNHEANVRRVAARCSQISVDAVNAYIKRRLEEARTTTVKTERSIILTLWKWGWEQGLVEDLPRGIMRFKVRKPPTKAWTLAECRLVREAAGDLSGRLRSGVDRRIFIRCWISLGYSTGARFGDLWGFHRDNLDGEVLRWVQSKTGDSIVKILPADCLADIHQMLCKSPDGRILGWACKPRQAMRLMKEHLASVGLDGSSKWLRRSSATHVEMQQPGQGRHHLGHRSVGLFESNYGDWGQIRQRSPQPPSLT